MQNLTATLRVSITSVALFAAGSTAIASPPNIDQARFESAGIRTLTGRHLVLHTDLPEDPEIDRLPAIFDRAVPQWAEYFGVDVAKMPDWQVRGYLIADRRRFDALGLMPAGVDQFINGISVGDRLWLYDQPTDYYRRHLLLHEGTHVFMTTFLGGCGPGWYMEGSAELMATHRFDERAGKLTLRIMPRDRSEVPMLGRIKLIHVAVAADRALSFPAVMQLSGREQLGNEAYAWCWAAAVFLDAHPRYGDRFRRLKEHVLNADFNDIVRRTFAHEWDDLLAEWQAFIATLDYGYDFKRMAIDFEKGAPAGDAPHQVTIAADRGWQSSGVKLDAGRSYRITARGRYQIAAEEQNSVSQPWPCEPGGVTIDYHAGRPLGILLAAVDGRKQGATLADPFDVGLGATITPGAAGTLYLRVNDSPARLDDNRGTLTATIEPLHDRKRSSPGR